MLVFDNVPVNSALAFTARHPTYPVIFSVNKKDGVFDDEDEWVAAALAAQCAVALHRVQMTETMMLTEKL